MRRAEPPLHITVRGILDSNAQVRRTVHGNVWLSVSITQPGEHTQRLIAAQSLGNTEAHDLAAHAKARLLMRGAGVVLHGRAIVADVVHGQPCLRLAGTVDIFPLDLPAPHHETKADRDDSEASS